MKLQPKRWAEFQHYKDRSPPWIKLHRDILNNRDFLCLPLASRALAPMLWLLASESKDGIFEASQEEMQFRLRISSEEYEDGLKPLIDKGFFVIASGTLAECVQPAIPEREGETEKEKRVEKKSAPRQQAIACPPDVDQKVWDDWVQLRKTKRAAVTQTVINSSRKEAELAGLSFEEFLTEWCLRGYQGLKAEWLLKEKQKAPAAPTKDWWARGSV